jgi:hypothetical protein
MPPTQACVARIICRARVCGASIRGGIQPVARDMWFLVSAVLIILAAVIVIALFTAQ